MPKLPRISGAATVRALERLGFSRLRQTGSHVMMRRGNVGCVVPLHDELKVGTSAGVLRPAQVELAVFISNGAVAKSEQFQPWQN